jgi:hypothetical protein
MHDIIFVQTERGLFSISSALLKDIISFYIMYRYILYGFIKLFIDLFVIFGQVGSTSSFFFCLFYYYLFITTKKEPKVWIKVFHVAFCGEQRTSRKKISTFFFGTLSRKYINGYNDTISFCQHRIIGV